MTKVTYYMYYCDTCCKISEMMEMDGLDSVKCQKSRRRDMMRVLEMFNDNETKDEQCSSSSIKRRKKREGLEMGMQWLDIDFLERERAPSL